MERRVKCVMDKYCINNNGILEAFVLTGAEPSDTNWLESKVNIPETLWTAFCCYSKELGKWVAGAHWDENVKDGDELTHKTAEELNKDFDMDLFPSECLKFPLSELNTVFAKTSSQCDPDITHDCDKNADEQEDSQTASPGPDGAQASKPSDSKRPRKH